VGSPLPQLQNNVFAKNILEQDITNNLTIDYASVDWEKPGSYAVVYSVTDNITKKESSKAVTLSVEYNSPLIVGCKDIFYVIGASRPNLKEGITVFGIDGKDITKLVTVDDSLVRWDTIGEYKVAYNLVNEGEQTTLAEICVAVEESAPFFVGIADIVYEIDDNSTIPDSSDFLGEGVKVFDIFGNDITSSLEIDDSGVDYNVPNKYPIFFSVEDMDGNVVTATANLVVRYKFPQIYLDSSILNAFIGTPKDEIEKLIQDNATAVDFYGNDATSGIEIRYDCADWSQEGEYEIAYKLTLDIDGETRERAKIATINVSIETIDSEQPVLNLLLLEGEYIEYVLPDEPNAYNVFPVRSVLIDNVVKAVDNVDGDITNRITYEIKDADGIIKDIGDALMPGDYKVVYSVCDNSGNWASELEATLKVVDNSPPHIEVTGSFEYIIGESATSPDYAQGVVAWDNVDGTKYVTCQDVGEIDYKTEGEYQVEYTATDNAGNSTSITVPVYVRS